MHLCSCVPTAILIRWVRRKTRANDQNHARPLHANMKVYRLLYKQKRYIESGLKIIGVYVINHCSVYYVFK